MCPSHVSSDPAVPDNDLLAALPPEEIASFMPHLEEMELKVHDVVAEREQPFEHVWFPLTGILSVINVMSNGDSVEVGTVGCEGMRGLPVFLGSAPSTHTTVCQVSGTVLRMPASTFTERVEASTALRDLMNRYTQSYLLQVSQAAACNRLHSIEQRCAKWLVMTHDRVSRRPVFDLKQEFLAVMLGVRRAGVSVAAGSLQEAGIIEYSRGRIRVLDRAGLEAASCECYDVNKRNHARLITRAVR